MGMCSCLEARGQCQHDANNSSNAAMNTIYRLSLTTLEWSTMVAMSTTCLLFAAVFALTSTFMHLVVIMLVLTINLCHLRLFNSPRIMWMCGGLLSYTQTQTHMDYQVNHSRV